MMRLQRVGRRNDPSFRIVVTDKRTGPKSDKHVDRLGSYNPKMNQVQLDIDKAKEWLAKGVQPSDTVHNLLISQKVIEGKKINVLPKKAPIVDEEAEAKAAEEAAAEAETSEESGEDETPGEAEEAQADDTEVPAEETAEEVEEVSENKEAPAEETADEKKD